MADVVHRTTKQYLASVNTPDYPTGTWIINPDLSSVVGVANKYWKVTGDVVTEMSAGEKAVVDDAEAEAQVTASRGEAVTEVDDGGGEGYRTRALIRVNNQRINYATNRIEELQAALDAIKASSGPADNIRAAIPASWLATTTRDLGPAIQDYKDYINAGDVDV